ncbi:MAG TPA: c(7)-type cytochrome triheme domain-containing protein [Burkholderiales bacterium]
MLKILRALAAIALVAAPGIAHADGKSTYDKICAGCHATGVLGAPRYGSAAEWAARTKKGVAALYRSALQGTAKGMPPKGGRPDFSDDEVRAAVDHMMAALPASASRSEKKPEGKRAEAKPATAAAAAPAPVKAPVAAPIAKAPTPAPAAVTADAAAEANAFNRLLRPASQRNLPPTQDGIHDAMLDGTQALQGPRDAFNGWPTANAGNRVDWVKSLGQAKLAPRWERGDPNAAPMVFDLNIVREVKGSMPDVVYPHKQHTEWLDCSNCHPAIFLPQKGANQISMAAILLGKACGTCHGRVAFPVSECRLCHSKKKSAAEQAARSP